MPEIAVISPTLLFMFYVYVLKSLKDQNLYIGYTNNLKRRLVEHNDGENVSTSYRRPFRLIYYEAYLSKVDAQQREKKLKHFQNSYKFLKDRIKASLQEFDKK